MYPKAIIIPSACALLFLLSTCQVQRQKASKTLALEESLQRTEQRQWQNTHHWTDSQGFRFQLRTDQPFSYHPDSGLTARGGYFGLDFRRRYTGLDSTALWSQALLDSRYRLQTRQQERSATTEPHSATTGWKRKLVTVLLAVIIFGAVVLRWWRRWK